MVRPGRRPLPTATKQRLGNPGHRPLNRSEPKPAPLSPADVTVIPDLIAKDPDAAAFWALHAPRLVQLRLLTVLDVPKFSMACAEVGLYRRALRFLQTHGDVYEGRLGPTLRPEHGAAQRHLASASKLLSDFGFSPSDRARLITGESPTDDPLEALLRKRESAA